MTSAQVRSRLSEAVRLDLVGPDNAHAFAHELLPQSPQRWYLTGYLVPRQAPPEQRQCEEEELDMVEQRPGADDDDSNTDPKPPQVSYLPSSMGLTVLVGPNTKRLFSIIRWGDYHGEKEGGTDEELDDEVVDREFESELAQAEPEQDVSGESRLAEDAPEYRAERGRPRRGFRREPREESVPLEIASDEGKLELGVPNSRGLQIVATWRRVPPMAAGVVPDGTRSLSVFLVNDRHIGNSRMTCRMMAFQAEVELKCEDGFWGRPDLRGLTFPDNVDTDERVADMHYRDVLEYSVGHGVATEALENQDGTCHAVHTVWIPSAEVPRVDHVGQEVIGQVELSMARLGSLADVEDARHCLSPMVESYRAWILSQQQKVDAADLTEARRQTSRELLINARWAADRIADGIEALADPLCLRAFNLANRAMDRAARQRFATRDRCRPEEVRPPEWRAFQLAFILMNLRGLHDPHHSDRQIVDLLFFPTGGGKTEAYLGLAAFTLILRRLKHPGISSAGVSIIMRYTLRLLTLDQLGRAAALMCALELERAINLDLGKWPFEIGLWVGSAATPNRMGGPDYDGPGKDETAYAKLVRFQNRPEKHPAPIPLEECPWCGTRFAPDSFQLLPSGSRNPTDLRVSCSKMECDFSAANNDACLPILGVDEPIYRRLPCFLIATVDKFAALPWIGQVGGLFGKVKRHDSNGFYGPCDPLNGTLLQEGRLPSPDLIVQDELHLISGPLGTVAGIYETAIAELCSQTSPDGRAYAPKIVASTATVRRAEKQIRALFGRETTSVFPPPGPDRDDSFFAKTVPANDLDPGRLYLGVAAQGRSMKVALLRTSLALLAGAQQIYHEEGGNENTVNPVDAYMTLLGYFNSLRELGGSRRIIEDEVFVQCQSRWKRRRRDPEDRLFRDRWINREPVELTSRVSTNDVAQAKRQLGTAFTDRQQRVDVALATNMISVGLDIVRLGLMVVLGQPKTSSEYIQATSRVGRDKNRPGLVVTLLNAHKPRDRSHYERFSVYHRTFYRSVEATSVTPFSPRALDRALAGALIGLCRHLLPQMEPAVAAGLVADHLSVLQEAVAAFSRRARMHDADKASSTEGIEIENRVHALALELISRWHRLATSCAREGGSLRYQKFEGRGNASSLLHDFLDKELESLNPMYRTFRANRSMRDVEPAVDLLETRSTLGTNS